MNPSEEIRQAQSAELVDEDGNEVVLELAPGLPQEEIDALEDEAGVPLPLELRTVLAHTAEIDGRSKRSTSPDDAPVVLFQSPDLGHFLHETFQMYVPPHASLVDDVHEDRPFDVWRTNPGVVDHSAALASDDDDLREFAAQLDDRFLLVDLRSPEIGMGFSWGRYGPRTEVRRHGYTRVFAYRPPDKKPGLLSRVFG